MPLPVFDTQEAIPEAFRGEYVERDVDGKKQWHPNVEDVTGLKSTLEKKKGEALTFKERAEAAERKLEEAERAKEAKAKGISDEELQKIKDAEALARKPIEDRLAATEAENRKLKLDDKFLTTFIAKGGRAESKDRALRDLQAQCGGKGRLDLSDAGTVVVKDANGNVTTETLEHFIEVTYKAEALEFYKPSGATGGGGTGSITTGPAAGVATANEYVAKLNEARGARQNPLLKGKQRA